MTLKVNRFRSTGSGVNEADPAAAAATYHSEVQRFAKVLLFQQQQEAPSHLVWFEKQAAVRVGGATLTEEVYYGHEGQVLLGQLVVHQQTFSP